MENRVHAGSAAFGLVFSFLLSLAGCAGFVQYKTPPGGVWEDLGVPAEGLAAVKDGGLWGYADVSGAVAIAPQFAEARAFSQGLAAVKLSSKWGFVDRSGKFVVLPRFSDAGDFREDRAPVRTKNGWGFIDRSGTLIIGDTFDEADSFFEGRAAVRLSTHWGYVDAEGRPVVNYRFKAAGRFSGGRAPVAVEADDNEWGFIDGNGEFVIRPEFDFARSFSNGLAAVLVDGRWGYVDLNGAVAVNPRFTGAGDFVDDDAPAEDRGLWGIIGRDGNFTVQPSWKDFGNFSGDLARAVTTGGRVELVDSDGVPERIAGGRAPAVAPGTSGGDAVTLTVRVKAFRSGAPVPDYALVGTVDAEGEHAVPNPPVSDRDGIIRYETTRERFDGTMMLLGGKAGYFGATVVTADHSSTEFVMETMPIAGNLPFIETVSCARETGNVPSNVLIEQEEYEFMKPEKSVFTFSVRDANQFKIAKYFLQQGTKRIESTVPKIDVDIGKTFSVTDKAPIHAGIVLDFQDMTIAMPVLVRVRQNEALKKNSPTVDAPRVDLKSLEDKLKFLSGTADFSIPGFKFSAEYDNDKISIFFGAGDEYKKETKEKMKNIKGFVDNIKDVKAAYDEVMTFYKALSSFTPSGERFLHSEMGALGYMELGWGENGSVSVLGGRLFFFGSFGFEYTQRFMAAFIPAYVSVGFGGEVTVEFKSDDTKKNLNLTDFFRSVTLKLSPYAEVEGGVGIKGVASVSLALHGRFDFTFSPRPADNSGILLLDALLRVRILFVYSNEFKMFNQRFVLFSSGVRPEESPPESPAFGSPGDDLVMEDRGYLGPGSSWLGADLPPAFSNDDPLTVQPLKRNILPGSEPLLFRYRGTEFLFWTDDAGLERKGSDRTALMFSKRNPDLTWSSPRIVEDDGTADYDFSVVEHRGTLYVAWQNTAKKFMTDSVGYAETCRNSEIRVASYDDGAGKFGESLRIAGNEGAETKYFGKPKTASNGKTLAVSYVENSEGDYFLQNGMTSVFYAEMVGSDWKRMKTWLYNPDPRNTLLEYELILSDGGWFTREKAYVVAQEINGTEGPAGRTLFLGSIETVWGRAQVNRTVLAPKGVVGPPRIVGWNGRKALFFYSSDGIDKPGNIRYYPDVFSAGAAAKVFERDSAFSETFNMVPGVDDKLGIVYTKTDGSLKSIPALVLYEKERNAWSLPIGLSTTSIEPGSRAEAAKGVWMGDRIDVVFRSLAATSKKDAPPAVTLNLASALPVPDLVVTPEKVYRYYGAQHGGELVRVSVEVYNRGFATADGLALEVHDDKRDFSGFYSLYKHLALKPGESTVLSVEYRLPWNAETSPKLSLKAVVINGREIDTADNTVPVDFNEPDLRLGDVTMERHGFRRDFIVPVLNNSPVPIRNVKLSFYDGADPERRRRIGSDVTWQVIKPFESATGTAALSLETIDWSEGPVKTVYFEATSDDVHKPGYRSDSFLLINPYKYPAFSLAAFEARASGAGFIRVTAAASNNWPKEQKGKLTIAVVDGNDDPYGKPYEKTITVKPGNAELVTNLFAVKGDPRSYKVRITMEAAPTAVPGSAEIGGLTEVGGSPEPVEVPVAPEYPRED